MRWTRSDALPLAAPLCAQCGGLGFRCLADQETGSPCNCVLRAVFTACYHHYRYCENRENMMTQAPLWHERGPSQRVMYSRKSEEYAADFILLTRRTLTESQYRLFDLHYLRCLDWRKAAPRLGLDRGEFFREAYRIQQRLGRVYRETVPYGLWPLDEYFHDAIRGREPQAMPGTPAVLAPKVLTAGRSAA